MGDDDFCLSLCECTCLPELPSGGHVLRGGKASSTCSSTMQQRGPRRDSLGAGGGEGERTHPASCLRPVPSRPRARPSTRAGAWPAPPPHRIPLPPPSLPPRPRSPPAGARGKVCLSPTTKERRSPPRRPGPRDAPMSLPPAEPGSHRNTEAARSRSSSSSGCGAAASMLGRRSNCRSPRRVSGRLHALSSARKEAGNGGGAGADPPPPRAVAREGAGIPRSHPQPWEEPRAHRPAAAYPTRGYTWPGGQEKVGFQGFFLYIFFFSRSFWNNYSKTSQEGQRRWLAVCSKATFGGFRS